MKSNMKHLRIDDCHIDTNANHVSPSTSNLNVISPSSLYSPYSPYTPSSANNDNHLKFKLPLKPTPSKSFSKGSSKRSKKKPKSDANKFAIEFYKNAKVKSVMAGHGIIGQFEAKLMLAYYRNVDVENIEDSDVALTYLEHKSLRHLKRTLAAMDETIRRTFLYGSDYTHFHQQKPCNDNSEATTKQIEKQHKQTSNVSNTSVFDPLKGAQNVVLKPKNGLNFKKNFDKNKKQYITHSDEDASHDSIWTESRTNSMDVSHLHRCISHDSSDPYVLTEMNNSNSGSINFVNYDNDNVNINTPQHLAIPTPIQNMTNKLSLSPNFSLTASVSLDSDNNDIVQSEMDTTEKKDNVAPKLSQHKQRSVSADTIYRIDSLLLDQDNIPPMKAYGSVDSTTLNEMELPSANDPSLSAADILKCHLNEPRLAPSRRKTYNYSYL